MLRWVDRTRRDTLAPTARPRVLRVTIWYPAAGSGPAGPGRYMTAGGAAVFERLEGAPRGTFHALETHAHPGAPPARGPFPVVLFSPAFGLTTSLYTSFVEDLAARGYVVVAIDPTYEAFAVDLPGDGLAMAHRPSGLDALPKLLAVRVADVSFVLDRLEALDRRGLFAGRLDLARVGMFGHSFGGATAVNAALVDPRLRAVLDLDGSMLGPVVGRDLSTPVALVTSTDAYSEDPTLQALWSHLRGQRFNLTIVRSEHYTFTDLVTLLPQFGPAVPPGLQYEPIGKLPARRAIRAVRACVAAFFDHVLRGRGEGILTDPSRVFPDVRVIASH